MLLALVKIVKQDNRKWKLIPINLLMEINVRIISLKYQKKQKNSMTIQQEAIACYQNPKDILKMQKQKFKNMIQIYLQFSSMIKTIYLQHIKAIDKYSKNN